jgi:hypothetical protein
MLDHKPYTPEWTRRRYLKEALDAYFESGADPHDIYNDISAILCERSTRAFQEFSRVNALEAKFHAD